MDMFGTYFDRAYPYPSFNVQDLDSLDKQAGKDLLNEVNTGNFSLLIGHLIGVDHAGHTYHAGHKEIERKLNDTEQLITQIIDIMDNETTLLVFGDHGMTDDGNHGGASLQELRSVLFVYSKIPFKHSKYAWSDNLMRGLKQLDIPSIATSLLGLESRPFQNLGVLHPSFSRKAFINETLTEFQEHLNGLEEYVRAYCNISLEAWCQEQLQDIEMKNSHVRNVSNPYDQIEEIHAYMNDKYRLFQSLWVSYDEGNIIIGLGFAAILLVANLIQTETTLQYHINGN